MMGIKDKRGFSLIELIVVIAILGILTSVVGGSLAAINGSRVNECAAKLEAVIARTRLDSLAREGNTYLILKKTDSNITVGTYSGGTLLKEESVGAPQLEIICTGSDGNTFNVGDIQYLYLTFSRSTGAFKTMGEAAALHGASAANTTYCERIEVKSGARTAALKLVPATGRVARD